MRILVSRSNKSAVGFTMALCLSHICFSAPSSDSVWSFLEQTYHLKASTGIKIMNRCFWRPGNGFEEREINIKNHEVRLGPRYEQSGRQIEI